MTKKQQREHNKKLKLIEQIDAMNKLMGKAPSLLNYLADTYSLEAIKYKHADTEEQLGYHKKPQIQYFIDDILESLNESIYQ